MGTVVVLLICAGTVPALADQRPNFVFFLVDDLRYNGIGAGGHPYVNTPNIDRIAQEGLRFDAAYCSTPLCGPSRHSFLTGKYARTTGARSNEASIDWSAHRSFTKLLQEAGYQTAFIGKSHLGNYGAPVPGFNYWVGFPGQGVYYGTSSSPIDLKISTDGTTYTTVLYTNNEYNTDLLTQYARNWLEGLDDAGPPPAFCLCLWYKAVHDPREAATRHASLYASDEFTPLTPAMSNPVAAGKYPMVQDSINAWLPLSLATKQSQVSAFARKDARTVMAVDESVRDLLSTLTSMGQLDNTVIVFAGDNGYFFKDFGLGDKRWQFEPSTRIPWFVRYPPLVTAGRTSNLPVLNIDLAPTFLDLAGVPIPPDMQGQSLKPILQNQVTSWRTAWLTEYFQEGQWLHPTMDATTTQIEGQLYKYIYYPWEPTRGELYDLTTDPYEITSVINNPDYASRLATLQAERAPIITALTPAIPDPPYIDLGTYNHDYGILIANNGDGRTEPADIAGRNVRKNLDPNQDHYMYFAIRDEWTYHGNRPDVQITVHYYDGPSGTVSLQYDSSDFAYTNEGKYKAGGSFSLAGTQTWKQYTFHVTDAYFGNREVSGADFRINISNGDTLYLDRVEAAGALIPPPPKAANPVPAHGAVRVQINQILSWSPAAGATSYDVYFGAVSPGTYRGTQNQTAFNPGALASRATYFWRVDPASQFGTTTGDVWSFTTAAPGDFDSDGDVDQGDFAYFQRCLSGNGQVVDQPCRNADLHVDGDVDLDDYQVFQSCMGGANQPPGC